jgi:hypothetical protein
MHDQIAPATMPATGTVRRLQGLVAIGHGQSALARRLRWSMTTMTEVISGGLPQVAPQVADAVEMLFLELWAHPVVSETGDQVREIAQRHGWVSPLAWDDIDDPAELPNIAGTSLRPANPFDPDGPTIDVVVVARALDGVRSKVTTAERRLVVVKLHGLGWDDAQIATATCVTDLTIRSDRTALELGEMPVRRERRPVAA